MRLCLLLIFAILCCAKCVQSAKILGIFPVASYSHYTIGTTILKELASRGHDVTVLSPYAEKRPIDNYEAIQLTGFEEEMEELRNAKNFFEFKGSFNLMSVFSIHAMGYKITEATLNHPNTRKLLQMNETYDLVIFEQFVNEALRGISYHFKAPCVVISAIGSSYWTNMLVANPTNPAYIPEMVLDHAGPMNFWKRLENTALALSTQALYHLYILPQQDALMHEHFPSAPPLLDLIHDTPLVLLNSHISTTQAVPHVPNMIEISGYHVSPPKKLSEDLQKYLDDAKEGVVYFSMGSNLRSKSFPLDKRQAILNTFSKLKMKVLWKFEEDLPGKPDNVKVSKWLPQQDLLAHPNIKLFITHGGMLSTIEAIYHGVPVVGIPIYGDQAMNMLQAVNGGFAEVVDYNTLTEETFSSAIKLVLTNERYTENSKRRSRLMHDRPMKPMDSAMYWLEYVIRHKGAPQFRSSAMDLTWYQYFLLDVFGFMLLISIAIFFIFYVILKKLLGKKKGKASIANSNKKKK